MRGLAVAIVGIIDDGEYIVKTFIVAYLCSYILSYSSEAIQVLNKLA